MGRKAQCRGGLWLGSANSLIRDADLCHALMQPPLTHLTKHVLKVVAATHQMTKPVTNKGCADLANTKSIAFMIMNTFEIILMGSSPVRCASMLARCCIFVGTSSSSTPHVMASLPIYDPTVVPFERLLNPSHARRRPSPPPSIPFLCCHGSLTCTPPSTRTRPCAARAASRASSTTTLPLLLVSVASHSSASLRTLDDLEMEWRLSGLLPLCCLFLWQPEVMKLLGEDMSGRARSSTLPSPTSPTPFLASCWPCRARCEPGIWSGCFPFPTKPWSS